MNATIKILIAEHDPIDLEILHHELKDSKIIYESEVVQNEKEYINALQNFIPDIILVDYSFPSFGGPAAFKIREEIAPDIPFIIVSGTIGEEKSVELIKSGVTDCVLKDKLFTLVTKIERALKESREKELKNKTAREMGWLINNTEECFILLNKDLQITSFNNRAQQLYSRYFLKSLVKSTHILDYAQPERYQLVKDIYARVLNGAEETDEITVGQQSIGIRNFALRYKPATNEPGEIIGVFVSAVDITEQKKAKVLREFERRDKEALINTTTDMMWSVSNKFKLIAANKSFISSLIAFNGVHLQPGDDLLMKERFSPEYLAFWEDFYTIALSGQSIVREIHFPPSEKQPASWGQISFNPIYDGNMITGIACYSRDITERKIIEERLKQVNKELEKNVAQLSISNIELEQFAYVASHDLQEPLRMITSFLSQLEKKYADIIDARGKKYIDFAVDGARRMRQIILDLLEFSRVGRTPDSLENIDLNEMIREIEILFRKQVSEKKAAIFFNELPYVQGHRSPIRQVFQNLIGNALTYSKTDIPCEIHISAKESPTHWQFAVADNGIGIDQEYFEKIFVIFQRLHNKDDFPGTGMGLAVTKKIIENTGGKIWLESVEGAGSTFYFTLLKEQ